MPKLYVALAYYGIGFGLFSLPTGLFIGPHALAVSIGHMLVGALNLWIAGGLTRRDAWAWLAGVLLSFATFLLFFAGLVASHREQDTSGTVFYAVASIALLSVLVSTLCQCQSYWVGGHRTKDCWPRNTSAPELRTKR